jgi:Uma2 family endonuclease
MTLPEFLAWEERQELRYEFDGEQPVAMTGGTLNHDQITFNLRKALDARLGGGGRCRPFGPNVKLVVDGKVRYPDVVVSCSPQSGRGSILEAPVLVFEVLSASTSRTDRIDKAREYHATPSIQRYVILEQDGIAATVMERHGAVWQTTIISGDADLAMPEIGASITLQDCYDGIEFPPEPADEPG